MMNPQHTKRPTQRGRLVAHPHGGVTRQLYTVRPVLGGFIAYVACAWGTHYLAPDTDHAGRVVECTASSVLDTLYVWHDAASALAAIDQLAAQQAEASTREE